MKFKLFTEVFKGTASSVARGIFSLSLHHPLAKGSQPFKTGLTHCKGAITILSGLGMAGTFN